MDGAKDIILEDTDGKEEARRARYLGTAFGIHPSIDGQPMVVTMEAVPRPGSMAGRSVFIYVVFYALGALVLAMAILAAGFDYLTR